MAVFTPIEGERWAKIEGFDYEVSDHGRLRSLTPGKGRLGMLKSWPSPLGYMIAKFRKGGEYHFRITHRLVAIAFVPMRQGANEVNHKNGIKDDNRAVNLEWMTRSENMRHASDVLHVCRGENAAWSKFSNEQATEFRDAFLNGETIRGLARKHGVSRTTMQAIVRRRTYKDAI